MIHISQCPPVKPDATPEEVAAVAEGGGQQIFAQAVGNYPYKICYILADGLGSLQLRLGTENRGLLTEKCKKDNRT
jgi:hypothetical protein